MEEECQKQFDLLFIVFCIVPSCKIKVISSSTIKTIYDKSVKLSVRLLVECTNEKFLSVTVT